MSGKINSPDNQDFWDDGINFDEQKLTKKENKNNHKMNKSKSCVILNTINENDSYETKKENKLLRNHKLLKRILKTEESIPIKKEKKEKKQIDKLTKLYNKDISDRKRVEKDIKNLKEKLIKSELSGCTFKPQRNKAKNKSFDKAYKKYFGEKHIYQRGILYKKKCKKKLNELKKEVEEVENMESYPFKPEIKEKNLNKVLYGKNYWEEQANNLSNKIFLWRYMKARKDDSDKKKRLIWNICKNNDDYNEENINDNDLNKPKVIYRSISQKNSLLYKNSLHNILLSYKTNDNNNNNENIMIKQQ